MNYFKVTRREALRAALLTGIFVVLQYFLISHFYDSVSKRLHGNGGDFINASPISGFDAYTYSMLADWNVIYDMYRHPLLAFFFYPLYWVNQLLIYMTGINCAQFVVAVFLLAGVFYSFVWLRRLLREVMGLRPFDATMLSFMLFSFAFVMVSMLAPDHFGLSMPLLVLTLYLSGLKMRRHETFSTAQTFLLYLVTAGVTLSNGAIILLNVLFVNGRRMFRPRFLLAAVILPTAMLLGLAWWQEGFQEERTRTVTAKADRYYRHQIMRHIADTASVRDTAYFKQVFQKEVKRRMRERYLRNHARDSVQREKTSPISDGRMLRWTDMSTSRWKTLVENFCGESIQLHRRNLLQDISKGRPFIVHYYDLYNYVIEVLMVLLFLLGVWYGRKSRLLWLGLSILGFNLLLHLAIGFGIDEVYIMTAHWAYIIPLVYGFLLAVRHFYLRWAYRLVLLMLTVYLFLYNAGLLMVFLS